MANLYVTAWMEAKEVALGYPIYYATVDYSGGFATVAALSGSDENGNALPTGQRVRCLAVCDSTALMEIGQDGATPTGAGTGSSYLIPRAAESEHYFEAKIGDVIGAKSR